MPSHWKERLRAYIDPLVPLMHALYYLYQTLLVTGFHDLRARAFAKWFDENSTWFTAYESTTPVPRLIAHAHGVVLEIGAGSGNQLSRFNWAQIQQIYGIEPNTVLCEILRSKLAAGDMLPREGMYTLVEGRIEDDTEGALSELVGKVDTVVCIQVLCSVEDVEAMVQRIYALLKPGGEVVFWEHEASPDWVTRKMQGFWNILWTPLIGGCSLTHDVEGALLRAGMWEVKELEREAKPWQMRPRVWGRLVKR
ncbi:hypothetical protein M433DRAFT_175500 [Acidomyces richmondensis BFW]|nr:MAG: hypothetical protein FE78DRAFT_100198 [Acidomyces sp. 'richmondensis']KYG44057.1 hypothetical protein M433DRAFT_175500 [Acidomyces richmondensis BFW]